MGLLDTTVGLPASGGSLQYSSLFPIEAGVAGRMDKALNDARLAVRSLQRQLQGYGIERNVGFKGCIDYHFGLGQVGTRMKFCWIGKLKNRLNRIGDGLEGAIVIKDYRREAMMVAVVHYVAQASPEQLDRDLAEVGSHGITNRVKLARDAMARNDAFRAVGWMKQPGIMTNLLMLPGVKSYVQSHLQPDSKVLGEVPLKKSVSLGLSSEEIERFTKSGQLPRQGMPGPEAFSEITLAFQHVPDWNDRTLCLNLVHEASHKFASTLDVLYAHERNKAAYKAMTVEQATDNADSYGMACISAADSKLYCTNEEVEPLSGSRFIECLL